MMVLRGIRFQRLISRTGQPAPAMCSISLPNFRFWNPLPFPHTAGFLTLGTADILSQIILCSRVYAPCIVRCSAASVAPTQQSLRFSRVEAKMSPGGKTIWNWSIIYSTGSKFRQQVSISSSFRSLLGYLRLSCMREHIKLSQISFIFLNQWKNPLGYFWMVCKK